MNKKKKLWLVVIYFLVFFFGLFSTNVNADTSVKEYEKAIATSLIQCYSSGVDFKGSNANSPLTMKEYKSYTVDGYQFMNSATTVPVPNSYLNQDDMTCLNLVVSLINGNGQSIPNGNSSDDTQISNFLIDDIGYNASSANSSGECISFNYNVGSSMTKTQQICASVINDNGTMGVDKLEILDGDKSAVKFTAKKSSLKIDCQVGIGDGGCNDQTFTKGVTSWEDFKSSVLQEMLTNNYQGGYHLLGYSYGLVLDESKGGPMNVDPYGSSVSEYALGNNAKSVGTKFLLGTSYTSAPTFSQEEQFVLYQNYLKNYYEADVLCGLSENEVTAKVGQGYKEIRAYDGGEFKTCYAIATKNNNKKVNGISGSVFGSKNCDFECLTNWLKNSTVSSLPGDVDIAGINGHGVNDGGGSNGQSNNGEDDVCFKGAGPMGWILCPVISGVAEWGGQAYNWIENQFLQIRASIFTDETNGVQEVWSTIRNIANVGFIIFLLAVIFSQLTGIGIDNYGIKKILPKLIMCAILVNLSYLICELLIDLSNIVGNGLKDLLSSMGPELSPATESYSASGGQYAAVFGGGIIAAAIGMFFTYGGLGMIIMLLVALISCVFSILVLFVILMIRQAGVVIGVIVAPVAILCYVLPNTEKAYKKWFDLMKGFLIVYPICGLVIGAGDLVSRVFGNLAGGASGDPALQIGFALSAMLTQVLPYLFIPTLLKGSLAAMGNVGAKVSSLGRGLSGQTGKALKGTDAMKASMQRANDSRIMRRAGFNAKTGELNAVGRLKARAAKSGVGKALGWTRLQSQYVQAANDVRGKNIGAEAALTGAVAASAIASGAQSKTLGRQVTTPADYYEDQMASAARSGNVTAFETAVEAAIASGQLKDKDIAAMVRRQIGQTQSTIGNDGVRQNFYRKMAAKYGNGFMATDVEMRSWMQQSGKLKQNGQMVDYNISSSVAGDYASRGGMTVDDIKLGDVQKMSGDSMASMITSGIISRGMAEEALAAGGLSDDKKIMLGAAANGAVPTGMNPDTLKNSAQALARNDTVNGVTVANARTNLGNVTPDQVAMWTAPRAEDVTIRDVSIRNAQDGSKNQTDVLQVHQRGVKVTPRPVPPRSNPPTPPPTP